MYLQLGSCFSSVYLLGTRVLLRSERFTLSPVPIRRDETSVISFEYELSAHEGGGACGDW